MKLRSFPRCSGPLMAAFGFLLAGNTGCDQKPEGALKPNLPPVVELTHAPTNATSREYSYRMTWSAYDPDGRVDHFLYKVDAADPEVPDSSWVRTTLNEQIIDFDAGTPAEPVDHNASAPGTASAPHTFAIAAVDDQGMQSPTVYRAFFSTTVAPFVIVDSPHPQPSSEAVVRPSVHITFDGNDPDGPTGKPVRYVYRLFGRKNPDFPGIVDFITFATSPSTRDSMRRLYAPGFGPSEHCPTCTPWTSVPAGSNQVEFLNLVPSQTYLFAATGFDAAGAYDPIFSRSKNLLLLKVTFAGTAGPVITMFNEFFNFTYPAGGYYNDPTRYVRIEVPANKPVTIKWFATPPAGATMRRYRWAVDLLELDDETPRGNVNDWYHWSSWGLGNTGATVGPFNSSSTHLFFIEAEDNNGLVSLGIVQFSVVLPTFDKTLLIVQDCRLLGDQMVGGVYKPPAGAWPNKAELDTFFYARGGFPWRGAYATLNPPPKSPPGIFNGYSFDTVSTRQFTTGVFPLAVLSHYKYLIWYVDRGSATNQTVSIGSMSGAPNRGAHNTVATFLEQGGSAWLFGGGVVRATMAPWNRSGTPSNVFTNSDEELVAGRFMYDYAHWQSKIEIERTVGSLALNWNNARFNSRTPSRGYAGEPPYANLTGRAMNLTPRDRLNPEDNPPPLRNPDSFWYLSAADVEMLTLPNFVLEDRNGNASGGEESTLDTLYISQQTSEAFLDRPVMTYYHGTDFERVNFDSSVVSPLPGASKIVFAPAKFVFSGFPLWFFSRPQQIALVDFVLRDIWGLERDPSAPRSVASPRTVTASANAVRELSPRTARPLRTPGARR